MDKSRIKKSILIVVLVVILYGLLWISLVGLATLVFNTISHNKINWSLNANLYIIVSVIWVVITSKIRLIDITFKIESSESFNNLFF